MNNTGHNDMPSFGRVDFPGPFSARDVVVNGWKLPLLSAHVSEGDRVMLVIDDRLALTLTLEEAERFLPFLADAIAVAQGFGAHPSRDMDELPPPFRSDTPRLVKNIVQTDEEG